MTEAEAKTKWCPFARASDAGATVNRIQGAPARDCYCIASTCMAWREVKVEGYSHGYCGLVR